MSKLAQYWKAIVAAATPVFLLIQSSVTDGIDTQEWYAIAAAAIVAVGVFLKANAPATPSA